MADLVEDDESGGGDGEEAGAGSQHGTVVFGLGLRCSGSPRIIAILVISLKTLRFLRPVHVGSRI